MEFSMCECILKVGMGNIFPLVSPARTTKQALIKIEGRRRMMKMRCCDKGNLVERELEEIEREGEEWREMQNCGGTAMGVELLECLEREAIMGEDQGRSPTDYNRRAQIFHKSSKVFQALKHLHHTQTHP